MNMSIDMFYKYSGLKKWLLTVKRKVLKIGCLNHFFFTPLLTAD
jgi:hypothetical protein